jgi:hypothetical protein
MVRKVAEFDTDFKTIDKLAKKMHTIKAIDRKVKYCLQEFFQPLFHINQRKFLLFFIPNQIYYICSKDHF